MAASDRHACTACTLARHTRPCTTPTRSHSSDSAPNNYSPADTTTRRTSSRCRGSCRCGICSRPTRSPTGIPGRPPSRPLLPLQLARQSQTCPPAIRLRPIPAHLHHRMVVLSAVCLKQAAGFPHKAIAVQPNPLLKVGVARPSLPQKPRVLRIGYRVDRQVIRRQLHGELLVARQELPSGNQQQQAAVLGILDQPRDRWLFFWNNFNDLPFRAEPFGSDTSRSNHGSPRGQAGT